MKRRNEKHLYSVGEVCSMTNVTRKTLFYYDKIGLLKPAEREGIQSFKLYGEEQMIRLRKILEYRQAGLSISEIRELLDQKNADARSILEGALKRLELQHGKMNTEISRLNQLIAETKKEQLILNL